MDGFVKSEKCNQLLLVYSNTSRGLFVALMAVGKVDGCEGPVVSEEVR